MAALAGGSLSTSGDVVGRWVVIVKKIKVGRIIVKKIGLNVT